MNNHSKTIERLWTLFNQGLFEDSASLFDPKFVATWPQSREQFIGAENFLLMNKAYPGEYSISILRVIEVGDEVISEVKIIHDNKPLYAVSFWEFNRGKIIRVVEYWADEGKSPEWRKRWVVRY